MPSAARVRSFIAQVEQLDYVGALMNYYHPDAVVQSNQGEIRRGRDALFAHQVDLLVRHGRIPVRKVEHYAVSGDRVFINWVFELTVPGQPTHTLDEVAMQIWDGDRIRSERFYYDPAQLRGVI